MGNPPAIIGMTVAAATNSRPRVEPIMQILARGVISGVEVGCVFIVQLRIRLRGGGSYCIVRVLPVP